MKKEINGFSLGCNYWASDSGTEMWRNFSAEIVRKDFRSLAKNGVDTLRIFPNWRDFQPLMSIYGYKGRPTVYRMDDGTADGAPLKNKYGIDPVMLRHLAEVCDIAAEFGISLIIGLVTGWMSGRLFVPPALNGKNVITDSEALRLEHLLVEGIVEYIKDKPAVAAWDLGNECNCMGKAENANEAYVWSAMIASTVRAADNTRPVLSGMHSLDEKTTGVWRISDQAEITDCLTTHPYPGSGEIGANVSPENTYRNILLPTAQTVLYSSLGNVPAMIEEQGTLDNIYANEITAAFVSRANMASAWANGATGYLWWCAFDQKSLGFYPYEMSMRELGFLRENGEAKPVANEMKAFSEKLRCMGLNGKLGVHFDAVTVLTSGSDWKPAEASFILGKQAGLTVTYAYHDGEIPKADIYLLPSIKSWTPLGKSTYYELMRRVKEDGAVLYVSFAGGCLEGFEELFGLSSLGQTKSVSQKESVFFLDGERRKIKYFDKGLSLNVKSVSADVLANDSEDNAVFTKRSYGNGTLFFLNFGMEDILLDEPFAFEGGSRFSCVYKALKTASGKQNAVESDNPLIGVTSNSFKGKEYAVVINYSDKEQNTMLRVKEGAVVPLLGVFPEKLGAGELAVFSIR